LTNAATATYVAESNGQMLGFVNYGRCRDEDVADVRVGEIMSLYVAPDSLGIGLGRMLLGAAVGQLAAAGPCEAKLWVLGRNARAVAFYEHAGFVRDGTIKHRDMFGVPAIVVRYGTCVPMWTRPAP
jgi:diamine N-acetyltransferase